MTGEGQARRPKSRNQLFSLRHLQVLEGADSLFFFFLNSSFPISILRFTESTGVTSFSHPLTESHRAVLWAPDPGQTWKRGKPQTGISGCCHMHREEDLTPARGQGHLSESSDILMVAQVGIGQSCCRQGAAWTKAQGPQDEPGEHRRTRPMWPSRTMARARAGPAPRGRHAGFFSREQMEAMEGLAGGEGQAIS